MAATATAGVARSTWRNDSASAKLWTRHDPSEPGDRPTLERELRLVGITAERRALRDMVAIKQVEEAMCQRITHELDLIEEALSRPHH